MSLRYICRLYGPHVWPEAARALGKLAKNNNKFHRQRYAAGEMAGKKALRSAIFHFYQIHKDKGKLYTVDHFKGHYNKKYIYALIKTFEERGTDKMNLSDNGRKKKLSKNDAKKLKKAVNNKTGCSQRKLARKFGVAQSTISHEIKRLEIRYYKRKRAPKATEDQKQRQKERLQKLSRGVFRLQDQPILLWMMSLISH